MCACGGEVRGADPQPLRDLDQTRLEPSDSVLGPNGFEVGAAEQDKASEGDGVAKGCAVACGETNEWDKQGEETEKGDEVASEIELQDGNSGRHHVAKSGPDGQPGDETELSTLADGAAQEESSEGGDQEGGSTEVAGDGRCEVERADALPGGDALSDTCGDSSEVEWVAGQGPCKTEVSEAAGAAGQRVDPGPEPAETEEACQGEGGREHHGVEPEEHHSGHCAGGEDQPTCLGPRGPFFCQLPGPGEAEEPKKKQPCCGGLFAGHDGPPCDGWNPEDGHRGGRSESGSDDRAKHGECGCRGDEHPGEGVQTQDGLRVEPNSNGECEGKCGAEREVGVDVPGPWEQEAPLLGTPEAPESECNSVPGRRLTSAVEVVRAEEEREHHHEHRRCEDRRSQQLLGKRLMWTLGDGAGHRAVYAASVTHALRTSVVVCLALVSGCLPLREQAPQPWHDLDDLLEGRATEASLGFPLPWDPVEPTLRLPPDRRRELVHACLLLPMTGALAAQGESGLLAALLAWNEVTSREPGPRQVAWHVIDTQSEERLAVEGVDTCLLRGGLVVVTPPRGSDFDFLAGGLMDRGAGVFVPVAGLTDVRALDDRFVFVRPPLSGEVGRTLAEAAVQRRREGMGAALVLDDGSARQALGAWSAGLDSQGWRTVSPVELPGPEPEPWRAAFHDVVAQGATDILVIGTHTGNRPLIEELSVPAMKDVHLWFLEGRIHDALLWEAEGRGALDRVHFLVGRPPSDDFSEVFEKRWHRSPLAGAAEVYESVLRASEAVQVSEFLEPESLANAGRIGRLASAWSSAERIGESGRDSLAAAGYEAAFMRRKTAPSWIWEQVSASDPRALVPRRRPVAPSRVRDMATGFEISSRQIGTKPGHDSLIGPPHARCEASDDGAARPAGNGSPELRWSGVPRGAKSLALLAIDPDAPASSEVERTGKGTIPVDAPRKDFFHWVLVDIPTDVEELPPEVPPGSIGRVGVNDFGESRWDGPCPPWGDERIHRLGFHLYALDVPSLDLPEAFGGPDVLRAMEGHILSEVSLSGLYWINPSIALPEVPEREGF